MSEYAYVIYEDIHGDAHEPVGGYPTIEEAIKDAKMEVENWIDHNPRGSYSWEVYNVTTDKTVAEGK